MTLMIETRTRVKKFQPANNLPPLLEDESVVSFGAFGINVSVIEFQKRPENLMWRPKKYYNTLQSIRENTSDLEKLSATYMVGVILLTYIDQHCQDANQLKVFSEDELICLKYGEIIDPTLYEPCDCMKFYNNFSFILYALRTKYSMPRYDGPVTYPEILDGMATQINIHWIREMYLICASGLDMHIPTPWKY